MKPIAHSENDQGEEQSLLSHLSNVADLASKFSRPFQSESYGSWLGWWHDAGKVAEDVQAYLRQTENRPFGPDHSSAGMLKAFKVFHPLTFSVAGHHGGLPDKERLRERIQRKSKETRVTKALEKAEHLLKGYSSMAPNPRPPSFAQGNGSATHRNVEFWIRMLHSALVDADSLDTEAHFDPKKSEFRETELSTNDLWELFRKDQDLLIKGKSGSVNRVRKEVYQACLEAASKQQGIFSLTVTTGGGKTRSAMAFGLKHALTHDLDRVIVALPYTSIIDQNAAVYREIFGDRSVLEHHSSVQAAGELGEESDTERWRRLAAENWDAPIVVTTTVQLLESLFSNKNSRCRKLHNIARSVIVLDEVQTLPPHLLKPTLEVLQHLVDGYGVTLVLCTATQPALSSQDGIEGLNEVQEIIPHPEKLFSEVKRVEYTIKLNESWSWEQVALELEKYQQAMVVVNTIKDSMALLDIVKGDHVYHLSTQLCSAHRRAVLAEVKQRLAADEPVWLIATQVVEAGVDIDFPVVFRAIGPLDRIIQAAGRCNREGNLTKGQVMVFDPKDGGLPPGAYKTGTDVTKALFAENPNLDLHDPTLPLRYFRRLYDARNLDDRDIQSMRERFQFEKTATAYRLIEDQSVAVVVPYGGDGHREFRDQRLNAIRAKGWANRDDFRALQLYMVNLRERVHQEAIKAGMCEETAPGLWLWHGGYDKVRGLQWGKLDAEDLVIG